MGVVDGFKGASSFVKVAFVLFAISAFCVWIAFTCTGWVVEKFGADEKGFLPNHVGLWRIFSNNEFLPNRKPTDGWAKDWFAVCQALMTLGFLGINVALFLLILYMSVPSCQKNGEVARATAVVSNVTGVLYLIGVFVFGVKFKDDLGDHGLELELSYCFGLSVVALFLELLAGVLLLLDSKGGGTLPSE